MPYDDLRDFIRALEKAGELKDKAADKLKEGADELKKN